MFTVYPKGKFKFVFIRVSTLGTTQKHTEEIAESVNISRTCISSKIKLEITSNTFIEGDEFVFSEPELFESN